MPIYEYRCTSCAKTFEVIQKFSDPPLTECSGCSGKLEKLVSRTSFQLKGSGWFASGYAPKKDQPASSDGNGATGDEKKKDTKDSKDGTGGKETALSATPSPAASGGCGSGSCGCGH
jgi:putative FmdB family regulatory protein